MDMPILKLQKEEKIEWKEKMENIKEIAIDKEEILLDKENLLEQRRRIEGKIKRYERKDIDEKIVNSLRNLGDVIDSISDMQYALNIIWKRTQQISEELKEALAMPSSSSAP